MSRRKTERLLNLVICLLATRRPLSAEQIRQAVPGYDRDGDEAFQRMFERDKNELREIGIPIEVHRDPWEDEPGYRIQREAYELPEITLEPDEAAVLGLAAQVWQRASLAEAASGALLKLRAGGVATDAGPGEALELRVDTRDPSFPALWEAVRDRRVVRFDYRPAAGESVRTRTVEPWGVISRRGKWYVAGFDRDRQGPPASSGSAASRGRSPRSAGQGWSRCPKGSTCGRWSASPRRRCRSAPPSSRYGRARARGCGRSRGPYARGARDGTRWSWSSPTPSGWRDGSPAWAPT
ncbi:proteasome accessory factor B [Nonomuraea dietziae]|uniref:Proteasome accessory factor B n=1 Tax=Nonomuraea dietziae TaxID=65515 RepID=A0A7W5VA17_9ACTN|nr:proteasome accessory factor B [Nonomuraea dietziae]